MAQLQKSWSGISKILLRLRLFKTGRGSPGVSGCFLMGGTPNMGGGGICPWGMLCMEAKKSPQGRRPGWMIQDPFQPFYLEALEKLIR